MKVTAVVANASVTITANDGKRIMQYDVKESKFDFDVAALMSEAGFITQLLNTVSDEVYKHRRALNAADD